MEQKKQAVIIGGGASGLMCAIHLARAGCKAVILEQNDSCGRKLLATGNGRCNLTNLQQEPGKYHTDLPEKAWAILAALAPEDLLSFFRGIGIPTIDRDKWVYPASRQASAVVKCLRDEALALGVKIKTREEAQTVEKLADSRFRVFTAGWHYDADAVITACGCPASEVPGSSAFALTLAECFDLQARSFLPALTPLFVKGKFCGDWAGTRVSGKISLCLDGEILRSERGELQLTDHGISGIPVFQISGQVLRLLHQGRRPELLADFLPDWTREELLEYMNHLQQQCPYKQKNELLLGLLPDRLVKVLAPKKAAPDLIADNCKSFALTPLFRDSTKQAQVCSGGVSLAALNDFLEAAAVPGLYFCGDAVDLYGDCGGYNLHWAWASAIRVAQGICKHIG